MKIKGQRIWIDGLPIVARQERPRKWQGSAPGGHFHLWSIGDVLKREAFIDKRA